MHYFLGLEVWKRQSEIFFGQREHIVEILRRFKMEDYRPMATIMATNLNKVVTLDLEWMDPKLYRQMIGSLMFLFNTQLDTFFVMNTMTWLVHGGVMD